MYSVIAIYRKICPAVPTVIMSPSVRWALQAFPSSAADLPNEILIAAHSKCVQRIATAGDPGTTKPQQSPVGNHWDEA